MVLLVCNKQAVLATTAVGSLALVAYLLYRRRQKNQVSTKWRPVGKVKDLIMYPLKSGHRLELQTADCTEFGLRVRHGDEFRLRDRSFVTYKESTKDIVMGKTYPKMLLINLRAASTSAVALDAPNMPELNLEVPKGSSKEDFVMAFEGNEKIFAIDCGDEAAQWISSYLIGKPSGYRLAYHDASCRRIFEFKLFTDAYPSLINSTMALFGDYASFLLMNQASVDDLVGRIPGPHQVSIHNLRPNIVVDGPSLVPFVEDAWKFVKIGGSVFRTTKPCTRCVFATSNADTAVRDKNNEPLRTLKTYRKIKDISDVKIEQDEVALGVYLSLIKGDVINVGDEILVGEN